MDPTRCPTLDKFYKTGKEWITPTPPIYRNGVVTQGSLHDREIIQ